MATISPLYGSNTTITMDLANLATSSTFVAGRESSQIDNTSTLYVDALINGFISVGTTPTANTVINVYVWGSYVSLATTPIDTLDGTDSAETLTNTGILYALSPLASILVPATTSDVQYPIVAKSVCYALQVPVLPKFWGLYVSHNTGVNLRNNAVNTNSFTFFGVNYTVA